MTDPIQPPVICSLCHKPVKLETTKTDERGKPVHEDCYVQTLTQERAPTIASRKFSST